MEGLTKRELFAAMFLQALVSIERKVAACDHKFLFTDLPREAVAYADGLIAELQVEHD